MPEQVHLMFSSPPEGLEAGAFERWLETLSSHVMAVEGYGAARHFRTAAAVGSASPTMYAHLVVYTVDGDPEAARARLRQAVASEPTAFAGGDGIRFASFTGVALEGPIDLAALDHMYLVFSKPPARIGLEDYIAWYARHMRENLTADGFEAAWRYRLQADVVDSLAPADAVHAALYEVHGDLPQLRVALQEAADAGRVGFPDWFGEIQFASMDCLACSGVLTAGRAR